eukprot:2819027-Pyramimonas_sp.AAC.1
MQSLCDSLRRGLSKAMWGLWGVFGASLGRLGAPWGPLGTSWDGSGTLKEFSCMRTDAQGMRQRTFGHVHSVPRVTVAEFPCVELQTLRNVRKPRSGT